MKSKVALVFALALALSAMLTAADNPFGREVKKKIIEFSWDNPTPEYLDRNLDQIETYVPHDGIGINVSKIIALPNGKKSSNAWHNFTKVPYQREWYKADIDHLKKIHARARHLKYNFINTSASSFTGEFDLFDDEFWNIVCDKFAIFAWVAKQGGCTGIRFDLEDYGNQQVWRYRPSCGHSWAEAWDKARQRGRQWMSAVTKEYPDITVFCFFWLDLMMGYADGLPDLYDRLESCGAGLLVAFINGIYDVLPPNAKIVDGMEANGYGAYELNSYNRMRAFREQRFPQLLSPENRIKFRRQGSFACATFMDAYLVEKGKFQDYRKEKKMTALELFRRNFTWAVQYSDEFVWTWSESRKWFPVRFPHAWQEKSLAKYPKLPGPYMGMAMPGVEDAISYARDPWNYTLRHLEKPESLKNLLKNPDFENTAAAKAVLSPAAGSVMVKKLPCWETWQHKKSKGSFSLAEGKGIAANALLIKNVSHGCAHQSVKIDPESAYIVRASAKLFNQCGASLSVQWRNAQGKWCDHAMNIATSFTEDCGNGWKRATLVVRNVPENACYLTVMLNSYAGNSEDSVLFDNVEVFSMFAKEPPVAPHLRDALEKWRKDFAAKQQANAMKNEKKSPQVPENRVVNGNFQKRGEAVTDYTLPRGVLFKPDWATYSARGTKPRFFGVVGSGAGFADDSAGVIVGGNGCMVFHVRGVKPGERYRIRAKAKAVGSGSAILKIYWSSPRVKGPFDYGMGIPKFAFSKKADNSWMIAEGEIKVPEGATKFALIPTASGLKDGKDYILFDDLEAVLIP